MVVRTGHDRWMVYDARDHDEDDDDEDNDDLFNNCYHREASNADRDPKECLALPKQQRCKELSRKQVRRRSPASRQVSSKAWRKHRPLCSCRIRGAGGGGSLAQGLEARQLYPTYLHNILPYSKDSSAAQQRGCHQGLNQTGYGAFQAEIDALHGGWGASAAAERRETPRREPSHDLLNGFSFES